MVRTDQENLRPTPQEKMTLILVAANTSGLYQSSDYQLTDQATGAPTLDSAGSKQLQADFQKFNLQLAFAGKNSRHPADLSLRRIHAE